MATSKMRRIIRKYRPAPLIQATRFLIQPLFRGLFHLLSHVKIEGHENVPQQGAYLVVFNHVSLYDPPVVLAFWPSKLEILGAIEIWSKKGQGVLARLWGGIPIRRTELHRDAIDQSLSVLQSDLPLLLSPEGGRSHQPGLRKAKAGIVYLAETTRVPIIPVGVTGTTDDFFQKAIHGERPLIELNIGSPFTLPATLEEPSLAPRDIRQKKADYIMARIAELLPASYRGYYGGMQPGGVNLAI